MVSEGSTKHWVVSSAFQIASLPVDYFIVPTMTWLRWVPSSKSQLHQAEQKVLTLPEKPVETLDVEVGNIGDVENCKIHTIKVAASTEDSKKTPLVLVHGFGCGGAIFAPNLDALSEKRDVYAIDMLGFGMSSRSKLSTDAMEAEKEMVQSIEEWRQNMKLDRIVLLGHSLGGFVSSAYALRYPNRIKHLILEDPWGFSVFDPDKKKQFSIWARTIMGTLTHMNALSTIRAAGPYGFNMMKKALGHRHPYMQAYFPDVPDTIPEYLYHCNVRRPTGEEFFRNISIEFGWTKYPMVTRLVELNAKVGMTFIHADRTFIPRHTSRQLQEARGHENVKVYVVEDCGHTIHLERPIDFNNIVLETLDRLEDD